MLGNDVYACIGPADANGKPLFGLLRHDGLPDDLLDDQGAEQTDIDAGEWSDELGCWGGEPSPGESRS